MCLVYGMPRQPRAACVAVCSGVQCRSAATVSWPQLQPYTSGFTVVWQRMLSITDRGIWAKAELVLRRRLKLRLMLAHGVNQVSDALQKSALVDALLARLPARAQTCGGAAHHHQHVHCLEHEPARRRFTPSACTLSTSQDRATFHMPCPRPQLTLLGTTMIMREGRFMTPLSLRAPTAHSHHTPGSLRHSCCHDQSAERGMTADSSAQTAL